LVEQFCFVIGVQEIKRMSSRRESTGLAAYFGLQLLPQHVHEVFAEAEIEIRVNVRIAEMVAYEYA